MVLPQIQEQCACHHDHSAGQDLGDRQRGAGQEQLVCPDALDPDPAQSITEKVEQEQLALVFFMLPVKEQEEQHPAAPQRFI